MMSRPGMLAVMLVAGATAAASAAADAPATSSAPAGVKLMASAVAAAGVKGPVSGTHLWLASSGYLETPGDRNGYPYKACGPENDGEEVSTATVDLDKGACVVKNFRCGRVGGKWIWVQTG